MKPIRYRTPKLEAGNPRDVFILFSALNAMGYNKENNRKGMTTMRKIVRNVFQGEDWSKKYPELKKTFKINHPWQLLNVLFVRPKNTRNSELNNFRQNLRKFSKEPAVKKIWVDFKVNLVKETKKLLPIAKQEIIRLTAFIGQPEQKLKRIIVIANPLDACWSGYALGARVGFWTGSKGTGYIIIGPGANKNHSELVRHELLHLLAPATRLPPQIITGQYNKHLAARGYGNLHTLNNEYIVRSLNLLYESQILKKNISKAVKREEKDFPHIKKVLEFMEAEIKRGCP